MADLKALADAVIRGDQATAVEITKAALNENMAPGEILNNGLVAGMNVIGARFKANEVYIPEVLIAARAMKMAMEHLEPRLVAAGVQPIGKAVVGTVKGDLHDIGKNLVMMMLKGAGFNVIEAWHLSLIMVHPLRKLAAHAQSLVPLRLADVVPQRVP